MDKSRINSSLENDIMEKIAELIFQVSQSPKQPKNSELPHKVIQVKHSNRVLKSPSPNTLNRINTLYNKNRQKQQRIENLQRDAALKQSKTMTNFRVQNTKSKSINKKNQSKPIYERYPEIVNEKHKRMERAITQKQLQEQKLMNVQQSPRSASKKQVKQFSERMFKWEGKKNGQIIIQRAVNLNQNEKILLQKSSPNTTSQKIIENSKFKDKNLYDRMSYYENQKIEHQKSMQHQINIHETPFKPSLSPGTKKILQKSLSKRQSNVFDRISKSPSANIIKEKKDRLKQIEQQFSYQSKRKQFQANRTNTLNMNHQSSVKYEPSTSYKYSHSSPVEDSKDAYEIQEENVQFALKNIYKKYKIQQPKTPKKPQVSNVNESITPRSSFKNLESNQNKVKNKSSIDSLPYENLRQLLVENRDEVINFLRQLNGQRSQMSFSQKKSTN